MAIVLGADADGTGVGHARVAVWLGLDETRLTVLFTLLPMFTPRLPDGRMPDPPAEDLFGGDGPGFWEQVDGLLRSGVSRLVDQRRCALLGRRCDAAAEDRVMLEGRVADLVRRVRLTETRGRSAQTGSGASRIEVWYVDDPSKGWGRPIPQLALVVASASPLPEGDGDDVGAVTIRTDVEGRAELPTSGSGATSVSIDWRDALGPIAAHVRDAGPVVLGEAP